jgi:hypothetical protein
MSAMRLVFMRHDTDHFFELAVADRISHIPPDSPQNHLPLKMAALELDHLLPSH